MEVKKWYQSKTMWVNIIATLAMIVQTYTGNVVIPVESQALILSLVNIALRFITKSGIE